MAKIDKVKETIGYHKLIFGILIAATFSMIGWLFHNVHKTENIKIIFVTTILVLVPFFLYKVNKKILENIDELEDL